MLLKFYYKDTRIENLKRHYTKHVTISMTINSYRWHRQPAVMACMPGTPD